MKKYLKIFLSLCVLTIIQLITISYISLNAETHNHEYENGICECGTYQEAGWDQKIPGGWVVNNAGQLLWIVDKQNSGTLKNRVIINNDITLPDGIKFEPLGTLEHPLTVDIATYDDKKYTINLNKQTVTKSNYGLIAHAKGSDTDKVIVENIKVTGSFDINSSCENIAGVIGLSENNVEIKNVTSEVDITVLENGVGSGYIGGIVGKSTGKLIIDACANFGNLNFDGAYSYLGGIVGYIEKGQITHSANYANLTAANAKYVGGILGYVDNESFLGVSNSLNIGKITGKSFEITVGEKQYTMTPGEIVGYLGNHTNKTVSNNYISYQTAYGVVIDETLNPTSFTATLADLASGKIAYQLGSKFGQKLDDLNEGQYYYEDLIGLDVYDKTIDSGKIGG